MFKSGKAIDGTSVQTIKTVSMYWVSPENYILTIYDFISWIIWFIFAPVIFLIWLYLFITKKLDKKRRDKWIKFMKIAVILFIVVIILWNLLSWLLTFNDIK